MKNAEGRQIALKKSYYRVYEKQVGKAERMLVNRKKISKSIQKARNIVERLHNIHKLAALSKNICDLCDLLSDYVEGIYQKAPISTIVAVLAGLLYLVLPIDVLPDVFPVFGWIDDAAVLAFVMAAEQNDVNEYLAWKARQTIIDAETVIAFD